MYWNRFKGVGKIMAIRWIVTLDVLKYSDIQNVL